MNTCKVIAIENQKGGTGKSTTALNLGVGLSQAGKSVLLIDSDPQASLTLSLGVMKPDELKVNLATVMMRIINDHPFDDDYGLISCEEGVDGFGYRIVNDKSIEHPMANALLATGGSGKERNLIYAPKEGIAGLTVKGKKTPLNDKGIRIMTPTEWGKLQGFINYAFLDEDGKDCFSFPEGMPNAQQYKQFGNSVTIPAIKAMAEYMLRCLRTLEH